MTASLMKKPNSPRATPTPDKSADASLLLLDNQLCFALYSASLTMTKVYKPLLAKFDLTYPQYLVLLVLWEKDHCGVSELGERLFLDSGTLTPLLKRLEALEYVVRQRDARDERRVIVSLAPAGKRLHKQAHAVPQHIMCATDCSVPELVALTAQLTRLRSSLPIISPVA